jgi:hypothetical protein
MLNAAKGSCPERMGPDEMAAKGDANAAEGLVACAPGAKVWQLLMDPISFDSLYGSNL